MTLSTRRNKSNTTHVALPNSPSEANATLVTDTPNTNSSKSLGTPNTNSSKPPAKITPGEASNSPKFRYFIFELKNGNADEYVEGKRKADIFKKDFGTLISRIRSYASKAIYLKAKAESEAKCAKVATDKLDVPQGIQNVRNNSQNDATRILQRLSNTGNVDMFRGYFYTNSSSTEAFLAIRLTGKFIFITPSTRNVKLFLSFNCRQVFKAMNIGAGNPV